jgi:hypothetical protein
MLKILTAAALLLGAPAAFSQSVSSCPTAKAGAVWAKGAWLPCTSTVAYVAEPVPAPDLVSDMRCPIKPATGPCVFSWQSTSRVLPTDQTWVKDTASPNGTWISSAMVKFEKPPPLPYAQCLTYLYMGAPFTSMSVTGPAAYAAPVSSPLFGSVTLVAPLPANGTVTLISENFTTGNLGPGNSPGVTSWDFSSESPNSQYPNPNGQGLVDASFSFTTSNSVIVKWNMSVASSPDEGVILYNVIATSTTNGDSVSSEINDPTVAQPATTTIVGTSTSPGTWVCQIALATEF